MLCGGGESRRTAASVLSLAQARPRRPPHRSQHKSRACSACLEPGRGGFRRRTAASTSSARARPRTSPTTPYASFLHRLSLTQPQPRHMHNVCTFQRFMQPAAPGSPRHSKTSPCSWTALASCKARATCTRPTRPCRCSKTSSASVSSIFTTASCMRSSCGRSCTWSPRCTSRALCNSRWRAMCSAACAPPLHTNRHASSL